MCVQPEQIEHLSALVPQWEAQLESLKRAKRFKHRPGVPDNLSAAKARKLSVLLDKGRLELKGFSSADPTLDSRPLVDASEGDLGGARQAMLHSIDRAISDAAGRSTSLASVGDAIGSDSWRQRHLALVERRDRIVAEHEAERAQVIE
eukprot:CAMPEP_0170744508 /NCGR_PEP_ID=MMETSP0437-20130122/7817_1 /TAXON_ID=0 /ORGANISM="Sexangularia sp." /LENGTH=147 /DNA_ID=CAMNT_0011083205 /DNA_START=96 /DNA_END=539 /DNA_ORIENTATION=+